jgi:hypothetical protein
MVLGNMLLKFSRLNPKSVVVFASKSAAQPALPALLCSAYCLLCLICFVQ